MVLKRVGIDRVIWIKDFFRPLSDITLLINYFIGGFNPKGYYAFNIFLHGINSFLLFSFCCKWKWTSDSEKQKLFALIAGILFLTYPFHNESIVWVVGRASIVSNFFGFLSMLFLVSELSENKKILCICVCYFTALTSYESVIVLPFIIVVFLYNTGEIFKKISKWLLFTGITLILNLTLRLFIAKNIAGSYGSGFLKQRLLIYLCNFFKVTGRLFLPPAQNSFLFVFSFIVLVFFIASIVIYFFRKINPDFFIKIFFFKLAIILAIAASLPVIFGVSTKTSESDRFIYFPSFFLCMLISFLLVSILNERRKLLLLSFLLVVLYNLFFLEKNNLNWIKASDIAKNILGIVNEFAAKKRTFLINVPDELDGAYIFRQGFTDALIINHIDTSKVVVVCHVQRAQMLQAKNNFTKVANEGKIKIPPFVTLIETANKPSQFVSVNDSISLYLNRNDVLLYWNKLKIIKY